MPALVLRDETSVASATTDTQSYVPEPSSPARQAAAIDDNTGHSPTTVAQEVPRDCREPAPSTSTMVTPKRARKIIDYKKFF